MQQTSLHQQSFLQMNSNHPQTTIGIRGLANKLIHKFVFLRQQDETYRKAFATLLSVEISFNSRSYTSTEMEDLQSLIDMLCSEMKKSFIDDLTTIIYRLIPTYPKPSLSAIVLAKEIIDFRVNFDDEE